MGENGADVKGLICIPGKPTAAEVKKMINGENGVGGIDGATCSNSMTQEAIHNSNGSTLNYGNITITDYAALKKINDAVFFPAASKRNYYSQVYKSDNYGYYWTASGHSGGTNAYDLHFYGPGDTNGVFYYSGIKNPSNISRDQQLAVRLLVEVIEETVEK